MVCNIPLSYTRAKLVLVLSYVTTSHADTTKVSNVSPEDIMLRLSAEVSAILIARPLAQMTDVSVIIVIVSPKIRDTPVGIEILDKLIVDALAPTIVNDPKKSGPLRLLISIHSSVPSI